MMYEVKSPSQQPSPEAAAMAPGHQATVHQSVASIPTAKKVETMTRHCLQERNMDPDSSSSDEEDHILTVDLCPSDVGDRAGNNVNVAKEVIDRQESISERQVKGEESDCESSVAAASSPGPSEEGLGARWNGTTEHGTTSDALHPESKMIDRQKPSVGGAKFDLTGDVTKAVVMESDSGCAKSIPVHCIVEQVASPEQEPQVDIDTYAILPASTLFCEIVRSTLVKIGYSPTEALGAKGAIQIKNWRPLTFDTITDDPDATLEDILGELSSIATLRIRICSHLQQFAMEDIKDKLLQFLLLHSQAILKSSGCPLEKNLLLQISQGESPNFLPEDTQQAFSTWFKEKVQKGINNNNNDVTKLPESSSGNENQSHPVSSSPDQPQQLSPNLPQGTGVPQYGTNGGLGGFVPAKYPLNFSSSHQQQPRPRARTSFDPEHEVPRLQKWFDHNQHPSRDQMCLYMSELNGQPARQGRRPLDLTNIIYWFKNARAANRRAMLANKGMDLTASGYMDTSFGDSSVGDENEDANDCYEDGESNVSTEHSALEREVPDLPNKNAVYVVNPMLTQLHQQPPTTSPRKPGVVTAVVETLKVPEYEKEDIRPRDFSIPKLIAKEKHHEHRSSPQNIVFNGNKENELGQSLDDQPADLSLPKKRRLSVDDIEVTDSRPSKASKLMIKTEADVEEGYGSSNTSSPSPSPKSLNSSSSSLSSSHLGYPNMTHQALQMAAMSHALNMHYMHPAAAAMYGSPLIPPPPTPPSFMARASNSTSPRPSPSPHATHSATSPGLISEQERKKRSRVFIDPLTEIPKLEKWFIEDTHPSSYMIEKYTEELNMSPYRQRFPRLEAKNVQLWFKNHRAKVKRARQEQVALSQINHANTPIVS